MANLDDRVARLEATETIRQLLVEFVAACDDGYDEDKIAAFFADDGVMDLGPLGLYEGREQIYGFFVEISRPIPWTAHFQANYEIDIDSSGTEASGRWYGFEMPIVDGAAVWGAFSYSDRYRKEGERWVIARLNQRLEFFSGYDTGWVKEPLTPL